MLEIIEKTNNIELGSIKTAIDRFYKAHQVPKESIIELNFLTSDEMRFLNKKYLQNNKDTDVLSFPQKFFPVKKSILGTICISKNEIIFGKKHIIELVEHGLFHLIAYDHDLNPEEWRKAVKKYEKIH